MADDRRLGKEPQRLLPEFEPQPDRCRLIEFLVEPVVPSKRLRGLAQRRRGLPGHGGECGPHTQNDDNAAPPQMQQCKYREHDRHRNQRCARHHQKRHVDEEAEGDDGEQQGQRDPLCPQQHDDRVGQRDRAQREFLALGYVVLDEDAARRKFRGPQRKFGMEKYHPGYQHQQCARDEERYEYPRPAPRPLEVIEQHWKHQEFRGRAHGIKPRAPGSVRPQSSDKRQNKQGDWQ